MEQLMNGQRAGRIFATAGKVVAAINSGYKALILTPNGSTEVAAIVRCKDCKHRDPEDQKCDCGHDICWQLPRTDDWFCADGERRDDDA